MKADSTQPIACKLCGRLATEDSLEISYSSDGMLRWLNIAVAKFYDADDRASKFFTRGEVEGLMLNALQRQQARIIENLVGVIKRCDIPRMEPHLKDIFCDPKDIIKTHP
jgi:hypothetical protein